jgi:uncharacterized protein
LTAQHDSENSRFVIPLEQGEAELVYQLIGNAAIDLKHTEVPRSAQGHGFAEALVRTALDYARENRLRVIPSCPYVKAWLTRHPEKQAAAS